MDKTDVPIEYRILTMVALALLAVGTTFYHYVEHFTWVDAFYFCVITLTTVGYGDLTPKTDIGKLFTVLYILIGVGIIGVFISSLAKRAGERHRRKKLAKMQNQRR